MRLPAPSAADHELRELEARVRVRGLTPSAAARASAALTGMARAGTGSRVAERERAVVEWLLALPWRERSPAPDLPAAAAALDAEHHGLAVVKERLLDHVAAAALTAGSADAVPPALAFVGPSGVGKSTMARALARALGRPLVYLSLAGVRSDGELRGQPCGHDGGGPGRVLDGLRRAGVADPVIVLDDVDRTAEERAAGLAGAMLDLLDTDLRRGFVDRYADVEFDLSHAVLVTTAASAGAIPDILRDRLEIVRFPGYAERDKVAIAERFLAPRQLCRSGVAPGAVTWEAGVLEAIVRGWTREAGVRDLERRIGRVARRLARNVGLPSPGAGARPPVTVRASELPATLGPAPYADDDTPPADHAVGVARGLAYGAAGGEVIEIEVSVVPGRGRVQLTGALGEAMKESASAAVSYVRARAAPLGVDPDFQRTRDVHIHLPLAATPKDGPSAGVPIAAALVSALTGIPVRGDVALTGELTLRGRVLPVGGLAEKAGAAARRRVAHVVLPRANAAALDELAADVRAACAWHPVASMDDALAVALCAGGAAASPDRSPSGAPIAAAPDGGVS